MTLIPATCELWIDGKRYADGRSGENPADPFALADLTVTWGRENTVDQPTPATVTFTIMDPPSGAVRFDETVKLGSAVVVWSQLDGNRVVVFGGRVTDLESSYDEMAGAGVCEVVAADLMADLGNRFVGAEPWPAETAAARAARILTAVGIPTTGLVFAARPGAVTVSRMDVDRQPAASLLFDLAVSTGAVLWSAYDPARSGPYLYFEDPSSRASLYALTENTATMLWAPAPGASAGTPLSACQVIREPVKWVRAVTDMLTRVTVRYRDQTTNPDPTDRSVSVVSTADEKTYGARGLSAGTQLTTANDATSLAQGILAGHQPSPAWRTTGLLWDLALADPADAAAHTVAFDLLGGVSRLGFAIALTDLPYWTPTAAAVQLYIEGGSYTYDVSDNGEMRWALALIGAPATGLGGSLSYGKTDLSIRYADVNRSVTYLSMIGVGAAGPTGTDWVDVPGTWDQLPGKWSEL